MEWFFPPPSPFQRGHSFRCVSSLVCRLQTLGFLRFGSISPPGFCSLQPSERRAGGCRDMFASCALFFLAGAASPCPVSLLCSMYSGQLPFPSVWTLSGDPRAPVLGHHSSRMAPKWLAESSCARTDPVSIPTLNPPTLGMASAPGSHFSFLHPKTPLSAS